VKFVALDLETSGLNSQYDQINQIGLALFDNGQIVDAYSATMRASGKYKISIDALTVQIGMPPEDVTQSEAWFEKVNEFLRTRMYGTEGREVATQIRDWSERNQANTLPVVAINASFDHAFFAEWVFRQRAVFKTPPLGYQWHCAMALAKLKMPGQKKYSLDICLLAAGLPPRPSAHDALADAIAAGQLYNYLMNMEQTNGV